MKEQLSVNQRIDPTGRNTPPLGEHSGQAPERSDASFCKALIVSRRGSTMSAWSSRRPTEWRGCKLTPRDNGYCARHQPQYDEIRKQRRADLERVLAQGGREEREWAQRELDALSDGNVASAPVSNEEER